MIRLMAAAPAKRARIIESFRVCSLTWGASEKLINQLKHESTCSLRTFQSSYFFILFFTSHDLQLRKTNEKKKVLKKSDTHTKYGSHQFDSPFDIPAFQMFVSYIEFPFFSPLFECCLLDNNRDSESLRKPTLWCWASAEFLLVIDQGCATASTSSGRGFSTWSLPRWL